MTITKIYIKSFGVFKDCTFEPCSGMNVIYAPNESGKTTLADFVRYMFYGASQRKKKNGITFKDRYIPWDGAEISGCIEFSSGSGRYVLNRCDGKRPDLKKCSLFDVTCGKEIRCDTEPGEIFFGIDEKTFFNSGFITDIRSISSGESGNELMATISGSGIDDSTYLKIRRILNESYLNLSSRKRASSELNVLNRMISEQKEKIYSLECEKANLEKITESSEELATEISLLENRRKQLLHGKTAENIQQLTLIRNRYQRELEALKNKITYETHSFTPASQAEKSLMENDLSVYRIKAWVFAAFAMLILLASVFYLLVLTNSNNAGTIILLLVINLISTAGFMYTFKTLKRKKTARKNIFDKFNVKSYNEYIDKYVEYETRIKAPDAITAQILFLESAISQVDADIEREYNSMYTFESAPEKIIETNSFTNEDISVIIDNTDARINQLKAKYNSIIRNAEQISETEDLLICAKERYEFLIRKNTALQKRIRAYDCAIQILDSAFDELKESIAPSLYERAYDIFSSVAGSKYISVVADENFSPSVRTAEGFKSAAYLSSGTRDALDFSLRIAVSEMLEQQNGDLPFFMDDPFSSLDDERCFSMLNLIYSMSLKRQIFFTTCLSREGKYFADNPNVNILPI